MTPVVATDTLRKPLFWIAFLLLIIALLIETGSGLFLNPIVNALSSAADTASTSIEDGIAALDNPDLTEAFNDPDNSDAVNQVGSISKEEPPGYGILYMAFLDTALVLTVGWTALGLVIPQSVQANVQGIATCLVSLIMIVGSIAAIFVLLGILLLMVALFLAIPFGTFVYLALYGFFARGPASAILGVLMMLKIGHLLLLILAQQKFLERRGLILMIASSIVMTFVVGFLHGLVPLPLVSITDAIAGLIAGVCGCIWWIPLLITSIVGIIKLIQLARVAG